MYANQKNSGIVIYENYNLWIISNLVETNTWKVL